MVVQQVLLLEAEAAAISQCQQELKKSEQEY